MERSPTFRQYWIAALERERLETLGQHAFFSRHPQLQPPLLLAPVSAHYSWPKAMKLVGLGTDRFVTIAQHDLYLDLDALEAVLANAHARHRPVLMAVSMLGTTEFGGIDPIDGVCAARDRYAAAGLGFAVHVDAAWGGYLATLFRNPDGTLRSRENVGEAFNSFPSVRVHAAIAAWAAATPSRSTRTSLAMSLMEPAPSSAEIIALCRCLRARRTMCSPKSLRPST